MEKTVTIARSGLRYGKNYQQCVDILAFIKKHSPETHFELVSKATDLDEANLRIRKLEAMLEKAVEQRDNELFGCEEVNLTDLMGQQIRYDAELQAAAEAVRKGE